MRAYIRAFGRRLAVWFGGAKGRRKNQEPDLIEINRGDEDLEGEISAGEAETVTSNLAVAGRDYASLDVQGLGVEGLQARVSQVSL